MSDKPLHKIVAGEIVRIRGTHKDSLVYNLKVQIDDRVIPVKVICAYRPSTSGIRPLTFRVHFPKGTKKSKELSIIRQYIAHEVKETTDKRSWGTWPMHNEDNR